MQLSTAAPHLKSTENAEANAPLALAATTEALYCAAYASAVLDLSGLVSIIFTPSAGFQ